MSCVLLLVAVVVHSLVSGAGATCATGFLGASCEYRCLDYCNKGACQVDSCNQVSCDCADHGTLANGVCACDLGYGGITCNATITATCANSLTMGGMPVEVDYAHCVGSTLTCAHGSLPAAGASIIINDVNKRKVCYEPIIGPVRLQLDGLPTTFLYRPPNGRGFQTSTESITQSRFAYYFEIRRVSLGNSFIATIHSAYNQSRTIEISPADVSANIRSISLSATKLTTPSRWKLNLYDPFNTPIGNVAAAPPTYPIGMSFEIESYDYPGYWLFIFNGILVAKHFTSTVLPQPFVMRFHDSDEGDLHLDVTIPSTAAYDLLPASTMAQCQSLCALTNDCHGPWYIKASLACYLLKATPAAITSDPGSGNSLWLRSMAGTTVVGYGFTSTASTGPTIVANAQACVDMCVAEDACEMSQFNTGNQCYLCTQGCAQGSPNVANTIWLKNSGAAPRCLVPLLGPNCTRRIITGFRFAQVSTSNILRSTPIGGVGMISRSQAATGKLWHMEAIDDSNEFYIFDHEDRTLALTQSSVSASVAIMSAFTLSATSSWILVNGPDSPSIRIVLASNNQTSLFVSGSNVILSTTSFTAFHIVWDEADAEFDDVTTSSVIYGPSGTNLIYSRYASSYQECRSYCGEIPDLCAAFTLVSALSRCDLIHGPAQRALITSTDKSWFRQPVVNNAVVYFTRISGTCPRGTTPYSDLLNYAPFKESHTPDQTDCEPRMVGPVALMLISDGRFISSCNSLGCKALSALSTQLPVDYFMFVQTAVVGVYTIHSALDYDLSLQAIPDGSGGYAVALVTHGESIIGINFATRWHVSSLTSTQVSIVYEEATDYRLVVIGDALNLTRTSGDPANIQMVLDPNSILSPPICDNTINTGGALLTITGVPSLYECQTACIKYGGGCTRYDHSPVLTLCHLANGADASAAGPNGAGYCRGVVAAYGGCRVPTRPSCTLSIIADGGNGGSFLVDVTNGLQLSLSVATFGTVRLQYAGFNEYRLQATAAPPLLTDITPSQPGGVGWQRFYTAKDVAHFFLNNGSSASGYNVITRETVDHDAVRVIVTDPTGLGVTSTTLRLGGVHPYSLPRYLTVEHNLRYGFYVPSSPLGGVGSSSFFLLPAFAYPVVSMQTTYQTGQYLSLPFGAITAAYSGGNTIIAVRDYRIFRETSPASCRDHCRATCSCTAMQFDAPTFTCHLFPWYYVTQDASATTSITWTQHTLPTGKLRWRNNRAWQSPTPGASPTGITHNYYYETGSMVAPLDSIYPAAPLIVNNSLTGQTSPLYGNGDALTYHGPSASIRLEVNFPSSIDTSTSYFTHTVGVNNRYVFTFFKTVSGTGLGLPDAQIRGHILCYVNSSGTMTYFLMDPTAYSQGYTPFTDNFGAAAVLSCDIYSSTPDVIP